MIGISNKVVIFLSLILVTASCSKNEWNVPHKGFEAVSITHFGSIDTLFFSADKTSLMGKWMIGNGHLFFVDYNLVGIKEYQTDGTFISEHIRHGRGPDEMTSAASIAAYDCVDSTFVLHDRGMAHIHIFDQDYHRILETQAPFYMLDSNNRPIQRKIQELYKKPDPDWYEIYEYNMDCNKMTCNNGRIVLPVVSDHIRFNKYYRTSHSKKYFQKAHTLLSIAIDSTHAKMELFGNYPPVYKKGNLSLFSEYDFICDNDTIYVSFAADPNIYVLGPDKTLMYSTGCPETAISGNYTTVSTFEDYERLYKKSRRENGYYGRIAKFGDKILRTCKLDGDLGHILQVYEKGTGILTGRIPIDEAWELIGSVGNSFYAYIGDDFDSESFVLVRFTL